MNNLRMSYETNPITTCRQIAAHIRWMIRRDMSEVVSIENACFETLWCETDFIHVLRQRNCIGMVAECDECVVGYMVYELHKDLLQVLNFAVHPQFQRAGVGRLMVGKLASKLSHQRRRRIRLHVRETNLPAQLFFRAMQFRAISIVHDFYFDTLEDAYLMEYRYVPDHLAHRFAG